MSRPAAPEVLRDTRSEADAIALSIAAAQMTLTDVATRMGVSKAYLCHARKGQRTLPDRRVDAFCETTGSLLLRQFRDLSIEQAGGDVARLARLARMLRPA